MSAAARGANLEAIAQATGLGWEDWTAWLDAAGARDLPVHGDVAALVLERLRSADTPECANPEWWAQSVTVAYEQHLGRRVPGQRMDGTFDASASRTVAGARADVHARVLTVVEQALAEDGGRLRQVGLEKEPTTSETARRRFWRAVLQDGTRAEVAVEDRAPAAGGERCAVVARQSKVSGPEEAAAWKAFWKDLLARI